MNSAEEKKFMKRYEKFKSNNLPTPFWDDERHTLEYIHYNTELSYWLYMFNTNTSDDISRLSVNYNLVDALADLTSIGFYYSYTSGYFVYEGEKKVIKIGHTHGHSFEDVVSDLYDFPESFNISKDEEKFFSKQELDYLRRVKKYLLFIGLKDSTVNTSRDEIYKNEKQSKYGNAPIIAYNDQVILDIMTNKRNFTVIVPADISIYNEYEEFSDHDRKELIVDKEDNFKFFVEYTHREIKYYKEIKDIYNNENLNDNEKVVVDYFMILETF